jgi:hypothetical protein
VSAGAAKDLSVVDSTVRCSYCGAAHMVSFTHCLAERWPEHCGYTMTLVDTSADIEAIVGDLARLDGCLLCGCTDERACEGGCYWVAPGLCSRCVALATTERGLSA